jgi:single-strand DNA-binding protein
MNVQGKLTKLMDTQTISDKFKKREFVIETTDSKPQLVIFQLTQDKVNLLDAVDDGTMINVSFNVRGREYNGKYFNTLEAWKVEVVTDF